AMTLLFAAWEAAERFVVHPALPSGWVFFFLTRGVTTAVLMTSLTAFLMVRYRSRYEAELRRQSEEARRMRIFFENIVQDAGDAIISLDTEGIIRTWNRAAERIYGYKAEEIVGRSFKILVPPDLLSAGEPDEFMDTFRKEGGVRNLETRRLRKDGSSIMVRITRSVLRGSDGRPAGLSAIVRDITAEREMESRLIQAEKLAAIGEAAARTAHEVRNALAGIWGTIEVLQRSPAWREIPDEVGDEVKAQVTRISHIINDLLAYARPGRLSRRRADVHEILDGAIRAAEASPEAEGKSIIRSYAPGPLYADVDPAALEQAFHNLITNAHQAMEPEDTLNIATRRGDQDLEVRFTDNGSGMNSETLARAMDPFFTTKARGTGLGLAIARTIVEAQSGRIWLQSTPRAGTIVTLTFPGVEITRDLQPVSHKESAA
ncbi:MAG TPA: PAS domain S-box protein, partial [Candidatus Polarisedimenticolia bacterium]|nr:PAS domain S-box protein [Candidatus Polarisedimenticolia bacterium]